MFKRKKQRKVKRYHNIYRSSIFESPFFKTVVTAGCLALFVAVGWLMYEPAYQFIMNIGASFEKTEEESSQPKQPEQPKQDAQDGGFWSFLFGNEQAQEESSSSQPEEEGEPEQVQPLVHAVYMPENILQDPALRSDFIQNCAGSGINSIMFDLKNNKGVVTYRSHLPQVAELGSVSDTAADLAAVTGEMRAAGITPIGRIYAFKDPLASMANREAAVRYGNSDWIWLDNTVDMGGKSWLNPLHDYSQDYIADLAVEATTSGVEEILLDMVHFPVGYSVSLAYYGRDITEEEKSAELAAFIRRADADVQAVGGELSVYLSTPNLLDSSGSKYGSDPFQLTECGVVLGVMPASFGNMYNSDQLAIANPVQNPYTTVRSALETVQSRLKTEDVMVLLQSYTDGSINALNNKTYTRTEVEEQIRAAENGGIADYVLYSPSGDYSILFSGTEN